MVFLIAHSRSGFNVAHSDGHNVFVTILPFLAPFHHQTPLSKIVCQNLIHIYMASKPSSFRDTTAHILKCNQRLSFCEKSQGSLHALVNRRTTLLRFAALPSSWANSTPLICMPKALYNLAPSLPWCSVHSHLHSYLNGLTPWTGVYQVSLPLILYGKKSLIG